jgi:hypothetical protein
VKKLKYCYLVAALLLSAAAGFTSCMRGGTLESLTITPAQAIIAQGDSQQFTATAKFTDGTSVNWTSAADWAFEPGNVGTEGTVTLGTSLGTYGLVTANTFTANPITVTATAGPVSGTATVYITRTPLIRIEVTPINPTIPVGESQQFTAKGIYKDGTTSGDSALPFLTSFVTWSSSNPEVATIGNTEGSFGLVTAVAAGTTVITGTDPATGANDFTVLIVE